MIPNIPTRVRKHLTFPLLMAVLFVLAKITSIPPLVDWSWAWTLSPIWVDWGAAVAGVWVGREVERVVQFGTSFFR